MQFDQKICYSLNPTQFYYLPKLVARSQLKLSNQKNMQIQDFVKIYINPCILSYHNIDTILPLDKLFLTMGPFEFANITQCKQDVFIGKIQGDLMELQNLHKKNYYEPEFSQKSYRGGKRFIFKSDNLANQILKKLNKILPSKMKKNLYSINSVFRYNCFQPNDQGFYEHYDIPYQNHQNLLCSKYSLIIYLTEGENDSSVFKINQSSPQQFAITKMEKMTFVIFSQKYKHRGEPYKNSLKIFLRTDLIYTVGNRQFDSQMASNFNTACYMAKQGIVDHELQKYSADCFKRYSEIKFKISCDKNREKIFLYKKKKLYISNLLLKNQFITDGTDYFFSKKYGVYEGLANVLFDFFKGPGLQKEQIVDKYYINQEQVQVYQEFFSSYLNREDETKSHQSQKCFHKITSLQQFIIHDKALPKYVRKPDRCGLCGKQQINQQYQRNIFQQFNTFLQQKQNLSLIVMDEFIILNFKDIVITDDLIYFKNTGNLQNFNFASCQCGGISFQEHFTDYFPENMDYIGYSVPSIRYKYDKQMLIFHMDYFENGYVNQVTNIKVNYENQNQVEFFEESYNSEDYY